MIRPGPARAGWRVGWAWLSPVLLLSIPVQLLSKGSEALWLVLLVVVAPLLALFLVPAGGRPVTWNEHADTLPVVTTLLVVGALLWANLSLAGDLAVWLGGPRWSGALVAGGAAAALGVFREGEKTMPLFILAALLGLLLPLVVILGATDPLPPRVWNRVASQPAFRFPSDSPWVTEGRSLGGRRGVDTLLFQEAHRLTPLTEAPLRVVVSDGVRTRVEELAVAPGQPLVLRPGDRLQLDAGTRIRFEGGKRIPGAPLSGIAWADAPVRGGPALLKFLGLGITLVGGAAALMLSGRSGLHSRGGTALLGLFLLVAVAWSQCWALYAAAYAPELFLGGVTAEELLELPALVLRWGRWLAGIALVGLFAWFLASAVALRRVLAQLESALLPDLWVWGGLVGVAGLASLWPLDPWRLLLLALGLGASALAPLAVAAGPVGRSPSAKLAPAVGLALFVGLAVAGLLSGTEGSLILAYPASVAAPVACGIVWLARRGPSPPERAK